MLLLPNGHQSRLLIPIAAIFTGILIVSNIVANTYVLVRMKKITNGRFLWTRTIASTIVGQGIDTAIFASVAFGGTVAFQGGTLIWQEWMAKVIYEAIGTPLTYIVVNFLKKHEGIDTFDSDDVSYNPFKIWA